MHSDSKFYSRYKNPKNKNFSTKLNEAELH